MKYVNTIAIFFLVLCQFCFVSYAYEIPSKLISAVIRVDGGNHNEKALEEFNHIHAGATSTYTVGMSEERRKAWRITKKELSDPEKNKIVVAWYLEKIIRNYLGHHFDIMESSRRCMDYPFVLIGVSYRVSNDYKYPLVLAAYKGGVGRLKECNYDINCLPEETQNYVREVMEIYRKAGGYHDR